MGRFFKPFMLVFLFELLVGLSLNNNLNTEFNSEENLVSVVKSFRAGGNSDSSQSSNSNPAFMPPMPDRGSSREQSLRSQDPKPINKPIDPEIPQRFGYRTALSGDKKLPDNPGGGDSWGANNQDNEFAWENVQNDPEMWYEYQGYCKYQSKKIKNVI
jgi:hypothetical protein